MDVKHLTHLLYLTKSTAVMRIKKSVRSPHIMYGAMEQPESETEEKSHSSFHVTVLWHTQTHIMIFTCIHPRRYITQVHIKHIAFHIAVTNGLRMNILKVSRFTHQLGLIAHWYSYECILMWFWCSFQFKCLFTPRSNHVSSYFPLWSHINTATNFSNESVCHESSLSLVKDRLNHCTKVIMGQWHIKMSKMMKRKHTLSSSTCKQANKKSFNSRGVSKLIAYFLTPWIECTWVYTQ